MIDDFRLMIYDLESRIENLKSKIENQKSKIQAWPCVQCCLRPCWYPLPRRHGHSQPKLLKALVEPVQAADLQGRISRALHRTKGSTSTVGRIASRCDVAAVSHEPD